MLVSSAIDRVFSEWLYPAGVNRPAFDTLDAAVTDSATTFTVVGRQSSIPDDTILQIESELITTQDFNPTTRTVTVNERGYMESAPAAHALGTRAEINPAFPRITVFNAIAKVVSDLYGYGLYARATNSTTLTTSGVKTLPSGARDLISLIARSTGTPEYYYRLEAGKDFQVFREFTPPKYQIYRGGATGATLTEVYSTDFTPPTTEAQDLTTFCGVPLTLAPHIPMAVAGHLISGKELPRVQTEEIRRMIASEGVQVGAALNVGQALIQNFEKRYVTAEVKRQIDQDPTKWEFVS